MERAYKFFAGGILIGLIVAAGVFVVSQGLGGSASTDASVAAAYNGTVLLAGDVPEDTFIPVSDIFSLPWTDVPALRNRSGATASRGVPVSEFLAAYGVSDYDQLVFYADDYALTINRSNVTGEMILVPDNVSMRVFGGDLPINSWVKYVRAVVVVGGGEGSSITLNGRNVSYGSMLEDGIATMPFYRMNSVYLPEGRQVSVQTSGVTEGISLATFLCREGYAGFSNVTVSGGGSSESFSRDQVLGDDLFLTRFHGTMRLATNDSLQAGWKQVDAIEVA